MDGKKLGQVSAVLKDLQFSSDSKDVNILLLGETGVGKSTFINAVANYIIHKTWNEATAGDVLKILVPYEFTVTDKNQKHHRITSGNCTVLKSDIKTYVLPLPADKKVRLIDTPNIDDNTNLENILSYIGQFNMLHAICYLLRPDESPNLVYLEQILSRLDKVVGKNLIFVVTNTRENQYKPGTSLKNMDNILVDENKNVFCFDNESFRYLAAVKQKVQFDDTVKKFNIDSWNKSNDSWWSLIKYVASLSPFLIKTTISINEVQRFLLQLSQPLLDVIQFINDQLFVLVEHEHYLLFLEIDNFNDIKANLHIPFIDLNIQKLPKPATVCAALKCCSVYKVGNLAKRQYNAPCHDSCYLRNVPKDIIGSTELLSCDEIDSKSCKRCGCDYSTHKHIYYISKTVQLSTASAPINIETKEGALEKAKELAAEIINIKKEMEDERYKIVSVLARCAHFLRETALSPVNDIYKDYIKFLIRRNAAISSDSYYDGKNLEQLNHLLKMYEELVNILKEGSIVHEKLRKDGKYLPHLDIYKDITSLFSLKHVGKKIKELYHSQKTARKKILETTELVCLEKKKTESPIDKGKQINKKEKQTNEKSKPNKTDNGKDKIDKTDNDKSKQINKNENSKKDKVKKSQTNQKSDGNSQKKAEVQRPQPPPYSPVDPKVSNLGPSPSYAPPGGYYQPPGGQYPPPGGHYPPQGHSGYFPPGPPGYFPPGPPNNFPPPGPYTVGPYQPPYAPPAYPDPRGPSNPYAQYPSNSNTDKNGQEYEITVKYKPKSGSPPSSHPYPMQQPMYPPQQPPPFMPANRNPTNASKPPQKSEPDLKSGSSKKTRNRKKKSDKNDSD